jgi:selenocysteine-specific elongation factor
MRAARLTAAGLADRPASLAGEWLADPAHWSSLRAELRTAVAEFCANDPLAPGMPTEAARAALKLPSRDLVTALVAGDVIQQAGYLRLVTAQPAGAVTAQPAGTAPPIARVVQTVLDDLARDPFAAPDAERLRALGLDAKALAAAARAGLVLRVADLVVLAPDAGHEAARRLAQLDQPFTTSQARQALGTSRRVAIPLLEYLDRARVTERLPGDLRRIRNP